MAVVVVVLVVVSVEMAVVPCGGTPSGRLGSPRRTRPSGAAGAGAPVAAVDNVDEEADIVEIPVSVVVNTTVEVVR